MIYYGADCGTGITPPRHTLYVTDLQVGEHKTSGGLLIGQDRFGKGTDYIKPRWAKVKYKGDDIPDIEVGDWVLLIHGYWSTILRLTINGQEEELRFISKKCYEEGILAVSKEMPPEVKMGMS